jgi:AcrR family transcriptional regulator
LQAIAQRAGVAVGTIYNHFTDRNELFAEVFERRRAELLETLDAAGKAAAGASFETQLEGFVRTVFGYFDERRAFLRLALEGKVAKAAPRAAAPGSQGSMDQLQLRAERIIRVGLKEQRLRTEGAELFSLFLVAALRAVLIARVASPRPIAGETEKVIDLFLRGTAA